jgi:hypothetical protein
VLRYLTPYDARTFVRSAAMISATALLAYLVMRATDGSSTSEPGRLARLAVMVPLLGAIGSGLSNAQARSRGEVVALSTLGVRPLRVYAGSLAAAVCAGTAAAVALGTRVTDLDGLFPRVDQPLWQTTSQGWLDAGKGIAISSSGTLQLTVPRTLSETGPEPRGAVVVMVLLGSVAVSAWLELRVPLAERLATGVVVSMLAVATFQLVAAARVSPWALTLVPAALWAHFLLRNARR